MCLFCFLNQIFILSQKPGDKIVQYHKSIFEIFHCVFRLYLFQPCTDVYWIPLFSETFATDLWQVQKLTNLTSVTVIYNGSK